MDNLDTLGLILLLGLLILGGGYYLMFSKDKRVHDKLPFQDKSNDFEIAEELLPLIEFPPEAEEEYVPELPQGYGDDKITIMARDPEWIFAYWDISEYKRNSLQHSLGPAWDSSLPVLRIHDVTNIPYFDGRNSNRFFDVVINDYSDNWYVHVGIPNRIYCVELGRILLNGAFAMIARSNFAMTPTNTVSDKIDPEWMLVSDNEKKLFARIGHPPGISSGELYNRQ